MNDQEIIQSLQEGETLTFGLNGHNVEVMMLMAHLENANMIKTEDASLSQETRRKAVWVSDDHRQTPAAEILEIIGPKRKVNQ